MHAKLSEYQTIPHQPAGVHGGAWILNFFVTLTYILLKYALGYRVFRQAIQNIYRTVFLENIQYFLDLVTLLVSSKTVAKSHNVTKSEWFYVVNWKTLFDR